MSSGRALACSSRRPCRTLREIKAASSEAARKAARKDVEDMLDSRCETVETPARKNCGDLDGERVRFYRQGMEIKGDCSDPESADCLRTALEGHTDTMDASLTGIYELVLEQLESRKKDCLRSAKPTKPRFGSDQG